MKVLVFVLSMAYSGLTQAVCENDLIAISVSDKHVEVLDKKNNIKDKLTIIDFIDDEAGNFTISAKNIKFNTLIHFTHDHETWHFEGLQGYYTSIKKEKIDLKNLFCEYIELF